ncbi:MAG: hypothetical protein JHC28_06205 [Thermoprotei archaeon]|jgi:hypothetical protein|uniref:Uncharacterized protein n=1 Tax=Fervidicoccus fontis TaxID=683846 RepID=A0A7J3SL38_9CREN|nr:hypothetical protein [Thermoprotei archaeon]
MYQVPMKRILNADERKMKRNPRNEDLYFILRKGLEGKIWLEKVLDAITECETGGYETILILDKNTKRGIKVITRPDPSVGGNVPVEWKEISLLSSEDEWNALLESLGMCDDARILRQGDLVFVECLNPSISSEDGVSVLKNFDDPEVFCYYGWDE